MTIVSGAATGTAVLEANSTGKVASITIGGTNSGYTAAPSVLIANQGLTSGQAVTTLIGSRATVLTGVVGELNITGATLSVQQNTASFLAATTFQLFVMNAAPTTIFAPAATVTIPAGDVDKITGVVNFSATSHCDTGTGGAAFYQVATSAIPSQIQIPIYTPTGSLTFLVVLRSALAAIATTTTATINLTVHFSVENT